MNSEKYIIAKITPTYILWILSYRASRVVEIWQYINIVQYIIYLSVFKALKVYNYYGL